MAVMSLDCPHCGTKDVAFESVLSRQLRGTTYQWLLFLMCRRCEGGIVVELRHGSKGSGDPNSGGRDPRDQQFVVVGIWPDPPRPTLPEYLPDNVARFYRQGEDAFHVKNWDSAGAMYRKA